MASADTVKQRWDSADGKCECITTTHGHTGRCNKTLSWVNRGRDSWGAWEAHHIGSPTDDSYSNCRIYCWDCHKATL